MSIPDWVVEARPDSSEQWADILAEIPKRPVASLTIHELANVSNVHPHGVYILYDAEGVCVYVGKVTSRSLLDRLPGHFGRPDEWLSTLRKRFDAECEGTNKSGAELAFLCELQFIAVSGNPLFAAQLERQLHQELAPRLIRIRKRR